MRLTTSRCVVVRRPPGRRIAVNGQSPGSRATSPRNVILLNKRLPDIWKRDPADEDHPTSTPETATVKNTFQQFNPEILQPCHREIFELRTWVPGSRSANHPDTLDFIVHRSILKFPTILSPSLSLRTVFSGLRSTCWFKKILSAARLRNSDYSWRSDENKYD